MAGETNIGGIVGFLRLDATQFHREIQQALLEVESLHDKDVQVKVRTDGTAGLEKLPSTARAASKSLDDLGGAERRVEDATKRVNLETLKLSELRESGKAKASQLMAAEQSLARARRDERDAIFATYEGNLNLGRSQESVTTSTRSSETSTRRLTTARRELERATKDVEKATKDTDKATKDAGGGMGILVTAIATLGPALVPIAGGAVALAAGLGGVGVAGIAAFMGVKNAMAQNNAVGQAFQESIDSMRGGIEQLEATAAHNILKPFQDSVDALNSAMPNLTGQIGDLATIAGKTAGALVQTVITAFQVLNPLMVEAATYVLDLSQRFQAAAGGAGMASFVDYCQSVFPQVMTTIEDLVTTVSHLIQAFAPLGSGVLNEIRLLSELINAIDPGALSVVATAAVAVFTGFQTWKGLSSLVDGLANALGGVANMSERAQGAIRGLTMATSIIGVAIAALSWVMANNAETQREQQQATDDFTEALRRSNGVMDESFRKTTYDNLLKAGAVDNAKKLGITTDELTDAVLNGGDAMKHVQAVILEAIQNDRTKYGTAHDLRDELRNTNNELAGSKTAWEDEQRAVKGSSDEAERHATVMDTLANKYQWAGTTLQQVQDGEQKMAEQTALATAKMQEQNDAAGLLKLQLDELNGKAIDNAHAQNAYDRAKNALGRPVQQADAAIAAAQKQQAGLSSGHTSAGGSNAVANATAAHDQALHKLQILQTSGKATALQLASANDRVTNTQRRLEQATTAAGKVTGAASQAQRDSASAALAAAYAQKAQALSLTGTSDAAVNNREAIMTMIDMGNKAVGTNQNLAKSNEGARQKLVQVRKDVLAAATALGYNKGEVQKLLDTLDQLPDAPIKTTFQTDTAPAINDTKVWMGVINGVPTWHDTRFSVEVEEALKTVSKVASAIEGVHDHTVTISAVYKSFGQEAALVAQNTTKLDANGIKSTLATGGPIPGYAVGTLIGPGTGTSDSILAQVAETGRLLRVSAGEFVSTDASRQRNRAALEAGNRGAVLTVASGLPKTGGVLRVHSGRPAPQAGSQGSQEASKGSSSRMHPDDIKALGRELALAVRQMPRPRVDLDEFNRRLA